MLTQSVILPAVPQSVRVARHLALTFADEQGACPETAADVALAVSEAATNVVRHSGARALRLELARSGETLEVRVADGGRGHETQPQDPGMGLGLPIIAAVAAGVELRSGAGEGTTLTMAFPLVGREAAQSPPHADAPHADAPHADAPHADAPHADAPHAR